MEWLLAEEVEMKPKLRRKVYCIYGSGILVDTVAFIGSNSFILECFHDNAIEESCCEWNYDDYEKKWFTNLAKAKKQIISNFKEEYGDNLKVVKVDESWYGLFEKDEI